MEAYGIILTGFTLFGMLGLVIASLRMDDGTAPIADQVPDEPVAEAAEYKQAA